MGWYSSNVNFWLQFRNCVAVLCALALAVPPVEARTKKGDKLLKLGEQAESRKDYDAALAYYGGPYVEMLQHDFSWPFDWIVSHESGHIFRACDEYYDAGYGGCTTCGQKPRRCTCPGTRGPRSPRMASPIPVCHSSKNRSRRTR